MSKEKRLLEFAVIANNFLFKEGLISKGWIFDYDNKNWTNITPITIPRLRNMYSLASIDGNDKVLLFNGHGNSVETWIYDVSDNNWTRKAPKNKPNVSFNNYGLATLQGTTKIVLFGGFDNSFIFLKNIWIYDYIDDNWTRIITTSAPKNRKSFSG